MYPHASAASSAEITEAWALPGEFGLFEPFTAGVFQKAGIDLIGQPPCARSVLVIRCPQLRQARRRRPAHRVHPEIQ
jgi:hypothetical protein